MARVARVADARRDRVQKSPSRAHEEVSLRGGQVRLIRRRLLRWGRANFKRYSWRTESDPWLSFLAEFLLQRTRAAQVESHFNTIAERWPTARSLAEGGTGAVSLLTRGLGLHWRGPLLLRAAQAIAARDGIPPESVEELRELPGVGMYTSAAWLSLHRGKRAVLVDANVARWLSRMSGLSYHRDPRHVRWVKELADQLTPTRAFRDYNYAVLDFTMTICLPRHPRCTDCPLRDECRHGRGTVAVAPT